MQFRGHSLPVHQAMSVSCEFLPCPISSANFRLRDFFRLLAIGMGLFLPVHHFGMAYLAGSKVKIQQFIVDVIIPALLLFCCKKSINYGFTQHMESRICRDPTFRLIWLPKHLFLFSLARGNLNHFRTLN